MMNKKKRSLGRGGSGGSSWKLFADMTSGLLLLFTLIMAVCLMQAQKNYTEKLAEQAKLILSQNELEESRSKLEKQQTVLEQQESELEDKRTSLEERESELASAKTELAEQESELKSQRTTLAEQESELASQEMTLAEQAKLLEELQATLENKELDLTQKESEVAKANSLLDQRESELDAANSDVEQKESELNAANSLLDQRESELDAANEQMLEDRITLKSSMEQLSEANDLMEEQQRKIDKIIGVKAELVERLNEQFRASDVGVNIDGETGAMILDSNVLYEFGKSELTDEGKKVLDEVLPVYCYVLLSDEYIDDVGEIIIEGYADSKGEYETNIKLSQARAYAVAEYLLDQLSPTLTEEQNETLRQRMSVNGRSSSNLVLDEKGEENDEASRRVEIRFRLRDEEMIAELRRLTEEGRLTASVLSLPQDSETEKETETEETEAEETEAETESARSRVGKLAAASEETETETEEIDDLDDGIEILESDEE